LSTNREFDKPGRYQIRVKGDLDPIWSDWFDGLSIAPETNDETVLTGPIADQAALHGVLNKIRDLGLPLLAVRRLDTTAPRGPVDAGQAREG